MPIQSDNQWDVLTIEQWTKGINQQGRRGSIDDQEAWWLENLFPIENGNLRACWGPSAAFYTAPPGVHIVRMFFGFIGNITGEFYTPPPGRRGWMFLDDGNIDEVDLDEGGHIRVQNLNVNSGLGFGNGTTLQVIGTGGPGLITQGATVSGTGVPPNTTILNQQSGTTGGDGYYTTNNPTNVGGTSVSFSTGMVWQPVSPQYWASAKVWRPRFFGSTAGQNGGVLFGSPLGLYAWDGATLTSPGQPAPDWLTDIASTDTTTPIPNMPVGLPGIYCMEVYQSRLFVAGKDVISFSAPSNGADFSTANGGGSFGYFGDKLTYSYMDLAASAGYLFVFGDSSTDIISNIQLTGSGTTTAPYTTNFNYANLDPQVGQRFPRPVGRYGRYMLLFNAAGVFFLQGGAAVEIGYNVTNLWETLDTTRYLPTFGEATMFGYRVMFVNGRFTDPFGQTRSLLLMWHPKRGQEFWSVASQGFEITNIGSYEDNSEIRLYGTDGTNLYRLFAQPSPTLVKQLSTKDLRGQQPLAIKNLKRLFAEIHDNSGLGVSITGTVTTAGGAMPNGSEDVGFEITQGKPWSVEPWPLSGAGLTAAIDLTSTSPDYTLMRLHLASETRTLYGA